MIILGIETSCDETAASVAEFKDGKINILSNIVSSQIEIHKKYGGVVPEVAAREHVLNIIPVIKESLEKAGLDYSSHLRSLPRRQTGGRLGGGLDAIAVTKGPGLITSLQSGIESAKALAMAWNLPLIPIQHIEAHILANFINQDNIESPATILTVSGGHTTIDHWTR